LRKISSRIDRTQPLEQQDKQAKCEIKFEQRQVFNMGYKDIDFRVSTVVNDDGSTEVYFMGVDGWEDFELILALLQRENGCEALSNEELIYIREASIVKNGKEFKLIQDDMFGNYLYTKDSDLVPFLEELANNIINSIVQKLEDKGLR